MRNSKLEVARRWFTELTQKSVVVTVGFALAAATASLLCDINKNKNIKKNRA